MTEAEYEAALKRVDELMEAQAGTPEAEELSALADEIVAYEEEHFPIDAPTSCTCAEFDGEDPFCKLHGERRAEQHLST
jgi:HTH-type transcriptional regulator/antitoxin HigA